MSQISVTAFAQAAAAGEIQPQFLPQQSAYMGWAPFPVLLPIQDFITDTQSAQVASLLGAQVVKLQPRSCWYNSVPNSCPTPNLPPQNFLSWPGQPGVPSPNSLLVVNVGDIVVQGAVPFYFMNRELAVELAVSYLIPGSVTSPDAAVALPSSPFATWPPLTVGPYWYTPGTGFQPA